MANKNVVVFVFLLSMVFCSLSLPIYAQEYSPSEMLIVMERMLYGAEQKGSIMGRLEQMEKFIFCEDDKEATLPERVAFCWDALNDTPVGGVDLVFKLRTLEWLIFGKISSDPISQSLDELETDIFGEVQVGSLSARIDILMRVLNGSTELNLKQCSLMKGTLMKLELISDLNSTLLKVGDNVVFKVIEDVIEDGTLIIPSGSLITCSVIDVEPVNKLFSKARIDLEVKTTSSFGSVQFVLGADKQAIEANPRIPIKSGNSIRRFSIVSDRISEAIIIRAKSQMYLSVMQTVNKVMGISI